MKNLFLVISLCLILHTNSYSQAPQSLDIESAKLAIQNLQNLSSYNTQLDGLLNGLNYGPFQIVTKCSVCSYAWGSLCWTYDDYTYTWNFPSYTDYMNTFKADVQQLQTDLSSFNQYYQPLRSWFLNTLPTGTTSMQALVSSNTDNISANLNNTISTILSIQQQLNDAISNLTSWNGIINGDFGNIQNNYQNLQYTMNLDHNNINNYETGMACGAGDLTNQWTNLTNSINSQQTNLLSLISNYGISVNSINQNIGYIVGPLITMQNSLNGILNELNNAQITPNQAIQKLDTIVSLDLWNMLVTFAQNEL